MATSSCFLLCLFVAILTNHGAQSSSCVISVDPIQNFTFTEGTTGVIEFKIYVTSRLPFNNSNVCTISIVRKDNDTSIGYDYCNIFIGRFSNSQCQVKHQSNTTDTEGNAVESWSFEMEKKMSVNDNGTWRLVGDLKEKQDFYVFVTAAATDTTETTGGDNSAPTGESTSLKSVKVTVTTAADDNNVTMQDSLTKVSFPVILVSAGVSTLLILVMLVAIIALLVGECRHSHSAENSRRLQRAQIETGDSADLNLDLPAGSLDKRSDAGASNAENVECSLDDMYISASEVRMTKREQRQL